jgi:hypothetical protein
MLNCQRHSAIDCSGPCTTSVLDRGARPALLLTILEEAARLDEGARLHSLLLCHLPHAWPAISQPSQLAQQQGTWLIAPCGLHVQLQLQDRLNEPPSVAAGYSTHKQAVLNLWSTARASAAPGLHLTERDHAVGGCHRSVSMGHVAAMLDQINRAGQWKSSAVEQLTLQELVSVKHWPSLQPAPTSCELVLTAFLFRQHTCSDSTLGHEQNASHFLRRSPGSAALQGVAKG